MAGEVFARLPARSCRGSLSKDGNRFVVGDDSGQLSTWERGANGRFALRAYLTVPPAGAYSRPMVRNTACAPDGALVASEEYHYVRLRRFDDLSPVAEKLCGSEKVLEFGAPGFLVAGSWLLRTPELKQSVLHFGEVECAAVLPGSGRVVTTVDRPYDETAMGMRTWEGTAPVQIVDLLTGKTTTTLLEDATLSAIAVDEVRGRIFLASFGDEPISVYDESGTQRGALPLRSGRPIILVCREDWLLGVPDVVGREVFVDFWDTATLEPLASVSLNRQFPPAWVAASGRTLIIPDLPAGEPDARFPLREWTIER